jgi:hypothetical protein
MTTKRQRPSPDQWAKLDAALNELRDKPPTHLVQSLSREIEKRVDVIRTVLQSGWRIRDLAVFFKEAAGIDVSATTIQTALRQALSDAETGPRKQHAKRPRKRGVSGGTMVALPERAPPQPETAIPDPQLPYSSTESEAGANQHDEAIRLGSRLTQGANKRGQR